VAPSADRPLAELLDELSKRSPAPGGGSAAAWTGALGAALLEMAARFAGAESAAARAGVLRAQLLDEGERELDAYQPVLAAARLETDDPFRAERLYEALSDACAAPMSVARAAAEVAELAAEVAAKSTRALAGDAIAGVLLAEAASQSAAQLVEINLRQRSADPRLAEVAELKERAAAARVQVLGS
jgi:methenyltetrahydrofolate cyclohydrolase